MTEPEEKPSFQLTRELELLISAALVFALLQLPAVLDEWWERTVIHVGGAPFATVFTIYYAGKLVSYSLIAAIVTHFFLRGFWVAVMGLRSVFPAGYDMTKLDQGEILRKFYAERLLTLDQLEDRVDRLAASVFSFVFLALLMFFMLAAWAGVAWAIAFVVARITGNAELTIPIMLGVFFLLVILQSFVAMVDRTTKKRPVSPRTEAAALRVMKWVYYSSFNFAYAPIFFTFASHSSRRRMNVLLVAFMYAMIGFFAVSTLYSRGVLGFDSYAYYPAQAREHQLRAAHYDSLRDESRAATVPSIQSDIVEDPYLRLFVPYDASHDNERIRALCPGVKPLRSEGLFRASRARLPEARVAELERCFDRLYEIALDGKRVEKPGFVFYRHPQGAVPGRLAFLPIGSLQPGRHLLTLRHTPLPGVKKSEEDRVGEFYIPFWH